MMQKLEGEFAEWYNLRKRRNGAFWTDRYHCTLVDGGEHAWNCIKYIDLNMVRAGVVRHPSEWAWCGHDELVGTRSRYRLLDMDAVLRWLGVTDRRAFIREYRCGVEQAIRQGELERDPVWTESVALGSESFVDHVRSKTRRARLETKETRDGLWTIRETPVAYNVFSGVENAL